MSKYLAALLSAIITIITALAAVEVYTIDAIVQLIILAAGTITTYFVPLVDGRWAARLKTGTALVTALLTALAPLIVSGAFTPQAILVVILAGLNALAVQLGVDVRVDAILAAELANATDADEIAHVEPVPVDRRFGQ